MKLNLTPFHQVGDFTLGHPISEYINKYRLYLEKESIPDSTGIESYSLNSPETTICVKKDTGLIHFIMCHENLYYNNLNLIGLTIAEFIDFTHEKYYGEIDSLDFEEDNISQYIYEFEKIGLQVWEKGKNGKIVTIIVNQNFKD